MCLASAFRCTSSSRWRSCYWKHRFWLSKASFFHAYETIPHSVNDSLPIHYSGIGSSKHATNAWATQKKVLHSLLTLYVTELDQWAPHNRAWGDQASGHHSGQNMRSPYLAHLTPHPTKGRDRGRGWRCLRWENRRERTSFDRLPSNVVCRPHAPFPLSLPTLCLLRPNCIHIYTSVSILQGVDLARKLPLLWLS